MNSSGHCVSRRGVTEGPEKGNQHDRGHGEAALRGEAGETISSETVEKHLTFFDEKLIPVTAPLGPGNVTATGTLPEEEGANCTSSTLLSFLLVQPRAAAWEMPGWWDTGKAGLHTRDRIVGQILSWEDLADFAPFACPLCTSP